MYHNITNIASRHVYQYLLFPKKHWPCKGIKVAGWTEKTIYTLHSHSQFKEKQNSVLAHITLSRDEFHHLSSVVCHSHLQCRLLHRFTLVIKIFFQVLPAALQKSVGCRGYAQVQLGILQCSPCT